jgi:hypothetical protein
MTVVVKSIKPKRLNDKAFFDELKAEMNRVAKEINDDYRKTTQTWKHKPQFVTLTDTSRGELTIAVLTDDEIYGYVDEGTKGPYVIRPKRARALRFPGVFRAKTSPGVIGSTSGFKGGDNVYAKQVIHPGIKARNFSKTIEKKWSSRYKRRMEKAMKRAVKKSDHAI